MGIVIENEFSVPASAEKVMAYLLDVDKVAKCLPGAQLTEVVDANTYKGKIKIKMGAMDLQFAGTVKVIENDNNGFIRMQASGREEKGKGQAEASITAQITDTGGSTHVKLVQDINMSGAVAQYGRGMMADVAGSIIKQFATCLQGQIR